MNHPSFSENAPKRLPFLVFSLSFLFFAFIMWCAPYSSDDLEFASLHFETLGGYFTYALQYGNGRLLGNLCSILLSQSRLLCILVKSFVLSSCVILFPAVLGLSGTIDYLLSFILFVAIDPSVFGEVYAWTSGFSNYIPPVWLSLIIVCLLQRYPNISSQMAKMALFFIVFLLGFASQLFIEHSSGVNVILAFCFVLISLKSRRKDSTALSGVWLLSVLLGLAVMLVIPSVFHVDGNRVDNYRSIHLNSLAALILSCAKNVIQLSGHFFGACEIPLCFGAIASVFLTRHRRSQKANSILYGLGGVSSLYLLLSLLLSSADYLGKAAVILHAIDCVFLVIPFGIWVTALFQMEKSTLRDQMLLCLMLAFVSLVPLLAVTPIPTRVVYQSYVFVACAALLCFSLLKPLFRPDIFRYGIRLATTVSVLLTVLIGTIFLNIHFMAKIRTEHIQREIANGATQIVIFQLPYEYTTWDHLWSQQYSYSSDQPLAFSSMDFTKWMHDIYQ